MSELSTQPIDFIESPQITHSLESESDVDATGGKNRKRKNVEEDEKRDGGSKEARNTGNKGAGSIRNDDAKRPAERVKGCFYVNNTTNIGTEQENGVHVYW